MALILNAEHAGFAAGTYLRIDGIRYEAGGRSRTDGARSVDPSTPLLFHLYAYRSTTSRMAGEAPIEDSAQQTTLGAIGLLEMVKGSANLRSGPIWRAREIEPKTLWNALYRHLRQGFPNSLDDDQRRTPSPT